MSVRFVGSLDVGYGHCPVSSLLTIAPAEALCEEGPT